MLPRVHPLSEPSSAAAAARALRDPQNRSIEIGIVCTLLFHLLLVFVAPRLPVELLHSGLTVPAGASAGRDFNIELAPEIAAPARVADPFRFVETNPDGPENEPDQTANFSNRNQQSAQPVPATERDAENRPSVEGQDAIRNDTAIVSGDRSEPQPGGPVTITLRADATPAEAAQAARPEEVPLSGTEKYQGESPEEIGSNISDVKSPTTGAEAYVEGIRGAQGRAATGAEAAEATPRQPAPRPRVSHARPTILSNRVTGTYNVGPIGIDAKWSEFGDYLNELIDIVDSQWRRLLNEQSVRPPAGTHAIITFKLSARGEIEIVSVEETCGRHGTYVSLSAIRDRQPYRKWTAPMVAVLGESQTLTFAFYFR